MLHQFYRIAFAILLSFSLQCFSQVPTNGLMLWMPFSGNANDQSGNARNGTVNGATLTTDRFGNANSAYNFNGTSNNISIANFPLTTARITVSFWFNTTDVNRNQRVINHLWPTGSFSTAVQPSGVIRASIISDTSGQVETYYNASVAANTWHHYVIVYDGTALKLYYDNQLVGTTNAQKALGSTTKTLFIGGGNGYEFLGKIDDIRIYNRALNTTEINAVYTETPCTYIVYNTVTDTVRVTVRDTIRTTVRDTLKITQRDTIKVTVRDTVKFTLRDTLRITFRDTVKVAVTDTLIIKLKTTDVPVEQFTTIKVYPNPSTDKIFVDIGDVTKLSGYLIKFYNSLGQLVVSKLVTQPLIEVEVKELGSKGAYNIEVLDSSNKVVALRKILIY
ncbi:MAG: LamG-like jellyroll fold domain-containing protein [Candidatus Kapaibacterium sp.]